MITEFKNEFYFLSNFFGCKIPYRGVVFPSAEHAFQGAKAKYPAEMEWIADADTPGQAKRRGRSVTLSDTWDSDRIAVMVEVCWIKFKQPYLAQALLDTGSQVLVEGNYWHDDFWGNCMCPRHANMSGQNNLGKILMAVRDKLSR